MTTTMTTITRGTPAAMKTPRVLRAFRHARRAPEVLRCIRHSRDWPALVGGYLGLKAPSYPRDFRTPAGDVLTLREYHDLVTVWIIFFRHEYPVDPSCRTIVDAGANIGAFSLYAARAAPAAEVIALEPFPETLGRLEAHVARNGLGNRIRCRPWALSSADGTRNMNDAEGPSQSRGMYRADHSRVEQGGLPVEAITLATLWAREGIDRVDLLKMDIEGSEHDVLGAAAPEDLRRVGALALEYHPNAPKGPLFDRIRDAGFTLAGDAEIARGSGTAYFRLQP